MANHHFGKLADVWKHLGLAEVLAVCRPERLYDTHAGHAIYPMITDGDRQFGVLSFVELARDDATLSTSEYFCLLDHQMRGASDLAEYPAGPMIAMIVLGDACEYFFCDLDPSSAANLRDTAARLRLDAHARVIEDDGLSTVRNALSQSRDVSRSAVYLDPFDQFATRPGGISAIELCRSAAELGAAIIHWYGYDRVDRRHWLFNELRELSPQTSWWCGDVMITAAGADMSAGDLGIGTAPGTGFGLVCANVPQSSLARNEQLGAALARSYDGRALPDGRRGGLSFASMAHRA